MLLQHLSSCKPSRITPLCTDMRTPPPFEPQLQEESLGGDKMQNSPAPCYTEGRYSFRNGIRDLVSTFPTEVSTGTRCLRNSQALLGLPKASKNERSTVCTNLEWNRENHRMESLNPLVFCPPVSFCDSKGYVNVPPNQQESSIIVFFSVRRFNREKKEIRGDCCADNCMYEYVWSRCGC